MGSLNKPDFYPIPKFTPVLQSYDIPPPIILVSGSDPYPLLNPDIPETVIHRSGSDPCEVVEVNVDMEQKVDPILAMDIDPWIGFRTETEVVERITDLTVFELAGGTLGEPTTIVSATSSDSSADSQVGASQVVMDVVEIKVVSENAHSNHCDVCNVSCNSEKAFKRHLEGKIHLKNTQKLPVSSPIEQETQIPVANTILDQDSDKKNEVLLQNKMPVDSLFYCSIPELDCINQDSRNIVAEQVIEPMWLEGFKPSNGETHNDYEKLNVHQLKWCDVCKVSCSSSTCLERHISGKQHLKNVKLSEKNVTSLPLTAIKPEVVDPCESNSTRCELCGIFCTSQYELNKHISGKKHQKNLKKSGNLSGDNPATAAKQLLQDPMIEEGEIVEESNKRKANISLPNNHDDNVDKKKQKTAEEEAGSGLLLTCSACNVVCNGIMGFNSHVASAEHSAMVMKQINC